MRFPVKDTLTAEDIESGLKAVIKDGLANQAMGVLTGGIFLVVFALKLGAPNFVIGLLAAIPPLAQLFQLPSSYLVERIRNRQATAVYALLVSRSFLLMIAAIPFLSTDTTKGQLFLIIGLLMHALFASVGASSWNSWMYDLVPQERLGSFFSKWLFLATALGILLSLAAGIYIDYWKRLLPDYAQYGYSILFLLRFLIGILGVHFLKILLCFWGLGILQ